MSVEKNKANIRRLHEATQKRDWSALPDLFAANYIVRTAPDVKGPEGVKQMMSTIAGAFPDYQEKIENMVAEGDLVGVSYTLTGTFTGKYLGNAPTGKKFSLPYFVLARFNKDGKQVEAWMYSDSLAWYRQMGIKPPGLD